MLPDGAAVHYHQTFISFGDQLGHAAVARAPTTGGNCPMGVRGDPVVVRSDWPVWRKLLHSAEAAKLQIGFAWLYIIDPSLRIRFLLH